MDSDDVPVKKGSIYVAQGLITQENDDPGRSTSLNSTEMSNSESNEDDSKAKANFLQLLYANMLLNNRNMSADIYKNYLLRLYTLNQQKLVASASTSIYRFNNGVTGLSKDASIGLGNGSFSSSGGASGSVNNGVLATPSVYGNGHNNYLLNCNKKTDSNSKTSLKRKYTKRGNSVPKTRKYTKSGSSVPIIETISNSEIPISHNNYAQTSNCENTPNLKMSALVKEKPEMPPNLLHCAHCTYTSTEKSNLARHIRTHTGEKPYKCGLCNYSCTVKSTLITHERTHTGEKPFNCTFCNFSSAQRFNLVKHLRTHTGERPFKCTFCNYSSADKSTLAKHIRIHTGEKPFKCTYCSYSCTQKSGLQKHSKIHAKKDVAEVEQMRTDEIPLNVAELSKILQPNSEGVNKPCHIQEKDLVERKCTDGTTENAVEMSKYLSIPLIEQNTGENSLNYHGNEEKVECSVNANKDLNETAAQTVGKFILQHIAESSESSMKDLPGEEEKCSKNLAQNDKMCAGDGTTDEPELSNAQQPNREEPENYCHGLEKDLHEECKDTTTVELSKYLSISLLEHDKDYTGALDTATSLDKITVDSVEQTTFLQKHSEETPKSRMADLAECDNKNDCRSNITNNL